MRLTPAVLKRTTTGYVEQKQLSSRGVDATGDVPVVATRAIVADESKQRKTIAFANTKDISCFQHRDTSFTWSSDIIK